MYLCPGRAALLILFGRGNRCYWVWQKLWQPESYHIKGKCALAFVRWRIVRLFYIITIITDRQQLCPAYPAAKLSFTLRPAALACLFYNAYYVRIAYDTKTSKIANGSRAKYVGAKCILSRLPGINKYSRKKTRIFIRNAIIMRRNNNNYWADSWLTTKLFFFSCSSKGKRLSKGRIINLTFACIVTVLIKDLK